MAGAIQQARRQLTLRDHYFTEIALVVFTPTDLWSIERFAPVVELLNTRVDGGGK